MKITKHRNAVACLICNGNLDSPACLHLQRHKYSTAELQVGRTRLCGQTPDLI